MNSSTPPFTKLANGICFCCRTLFILPPDVDTYLHCLKTIVEQHCQRYVLSVASCSGKQGEKKNFLVKLGMQGIPHNATLLQLLQLLVLGQDNEMTACGVEWENNSTSITPLCVVGPQQTYYMVNLFLRHLNCSPKLMLFHLLYSLYGFKTLQ